MFLVQSHVVIHFCFNTCVRLCVLQEQRTAANSVVEEGGGESEEGGEPVTVAEPMAEGGS
jgi:hypothetical protein